MLGGFACLLFEGHPPHDCHSSRKGLPHQCLHLLEFCEFKPILPSEPPTALLRTIVLLASFALVFGCGRELKERVYDAPKVDSEFEKGREPSPRRPAAPMMGGSNIPMRDKRILGAIIPDGGNVYFVKATDRISKLSLIEPAFRRVVEQFAIDPKTSVPQSDLPSGWVINPLDNAGAGIGLAEMIAEMLVETADGRIRFTVSKYDLPRDPGMLDEYLLSQVNRWRGQVELPAIGVEELRRDLPKIPREGASIPAYLFDASGSQAKVSSETPVNPVVPSKSTGTEPAVANSADRPSADKTSVKPSVKLVYDKPEGWELQPARPYREATFKVTRGGQEGEVTVSTARDAPIQNAAMWIGQVMATEEPARMESLARKTVEDAQTIESGGKSGKIYSVRASDSPDARSLTVVSIPMGEGGLSMFVKLNCELRMMEEEKSTFLSFVNSLRWE